MTDYRWDVPGETFQKFAISPVSQTWGHADPVPATELTKSRPKWYWRNDNKLIVSCTANFQVEGHLIGTVKGERQVVVHKPEYKTDYATGKVILTDSVCRAGEDKDIEPGILVISILTEPFLFAEQGPGKYSWLQMIYKWTAHTYGPSNYKEEWEDALDAAFPYKSQFVVNDMKVATHSDSPQIPVFAVDNSFDVYAAFGAHMMYRPPMSTEWVPLDLILWQWEASGSKSGLSTWTLSGTVKVITETPASTHPHWTKKRQDN